MWFVGYTYSLTDKFDISSSIGCYWGYLLGGISKYQSYYFLSAADVANISDNEPIMYPVLSEGYHEHKREESIEKSYYNDFDFGVGGRLSVIYKICSRMSLRLSGVYRHGLSNILKPNDGWLEKYTRSFNLTAGVVVNI